LAGLLFLEIVVITSLIILTNPEAYSWHENLGIDSNKAAELYNTSPNDPAINQWKNALQLAINDMDKCFTLEEAISCKTLISMITNNCNTHPNELLACNDTRLPQYPSILQKAEEAQRKIEEAKKKAEREQIENLTVAYSSKLKETAASLIIDRCIEKTYENPYANPRFEITDASCNVKLSSLQEDCQNVYPIYKYCKDERFVGYFGQNDTLNSTISP
jgi:hypothetical protein